MIKKIKILQLSTTLAIFALSSLYSSLSSFADPIQFDDTGQASITNEMLHVELTFQKHFDDSNNQHSTRPTLTTDNATEFFDNSTSNMKFSIEFSIIDEDIWKPLDFSSNTTEEKTKFFIASFDEQTNDWTWRIKVPYKDASGNVLKYRISESTIPTGYNSSTSEYSTSISET